MPRYPKVASNVARINSSVFSSVAHKVAALQGEVYPLHVGDTWLEPAVGCRMQDFRVEDHPGMHRYATPHGHRALLDVICEQRQVTADRVLVTAGVTGGLGAVSGALLQPGEEVLVLAPYWPLIRGIVIGARGTPVEVPFYDQEGTVAERIAPYLTDKTAALYINTPNNPTGCVLDAQTLKALAEFARAHDLWLWSDEVYEHYAYRGPHVHVHDFAPERTLTAWSFSKAYGMAGNRVGYLVGPTDPSVMTQVRKMGTHSFYSASTAGQLAGAAVMQQGATWLAEAKAHYQAAGDAAADRLGLPRPDGGTFLFFDVADRMDDRGLQGVLEDLIDRNVVVAPGSSFGADYGTYLRVCFTSAPPAVVARGIERLADYLGR